MKKRFLLNIIASSVISSCGINNFIVYEDLCKESHQETEATYFGKVELPSKEEIKKEETLDERLNRLYVKMSNIKKIRKGRRALIILGEQQKLYSVHMGSTLIIDSIYGVSTGKKGFADWDAPPYFTPTGAHFIWQKLGDDAEVGTLFERKQDTGRKIDILNKYVKGDKAEVVTRVLFLAGRELNNLSSAGEAIYIHGINHEFSIGRPASHGCIRMKNADIIELYEHVMKGTPVYIDSGK